MMSSRSAARFRRRAAAFVASAAVALVGLALPLAPSQAASAADVDTTAWYVLVNRNSGKALDVYNLATNDGARDHPVDPQRRQPAAVAVRRLRQRLLPAQVAALREGPGRLQLIHRRRRARSCSGPTATATNQQFRLADSTDGYVRLINRNSGKAVEVQGASTADGANVVQYADWSGNNQQWQLVQVGSGTGGSRSGTYTNPVVWQDFADGDIIRVGDAYYYSASTMHYSPGRADPALVRPGQLGVRRPLGAAASTSARTPTTSTAAGPT